jgi:hypothetical protein
MCSPAQYFPRAAYRKSTARVLTSNKSNDSEHLLAPKLAPLESSFVWSLSKIIHRSGTGRAYPKHHVNAR